MVGRDRAYIAHRTPGDGAQHHAAGSPDAGEHPAIPLVERGPADHRPAASPRPADEITAADDASSSSSSLWTRVRTMSRAPFLLRSSPALGTGSYGALPETPLLSDTDEEHDVAQLRRTRKGKASALRNTVSAGDDSPRRSQYRAEASAEASGLTAADALALDGGYDSPAAGEREGEEEQEEPPDNSPYPEVRASVSPFDNTSLSVNTPRMWTLSLLFAFFGSAINLFFSLRYPSISITPVIALLLAHPLGRLWDGLLKRPGDPEYLFVDGIRHDELVPSEPNELGTPRLKPRSPNVERVPLQDLGPHSKWDKTRLWLAQGKWNQKEHACVYISSNVSFGFAFATDVIVEQTHFYHQDVSIMYQLLLTISTQILGYGFAGLARRFLVRPGGMIWPSTLMSTAMFQTLHTKENSVADGWKISRWRFFLMVFLGSFVWYFVPGLLMPALSWFNVVTWFKPDSVVLANLFGVASGLGMFPLTFDWSQIAYIGSPLMTPFWASLNVVGGLVVVMWIIAPILYYKDVLFASYMPMLSSIMFDNKGKPYDVSKILTDDFLFDSDAYRKYSKAFMPITYVLSYALQFASLTALMTHTVCWHGKDIWRQWKQSQQEIKAETSGEYSALPTNLMRPISRTSTSLSRDDIMNVEDVHNRLMKRYKDAPNSWYLLTTLTMLAISIFVVEYYPVHLPWYGLLLALAIGGIFFIPTGIIAAITNQHSSLFLLCQLVCGVVFPGRPVANMVFVTYGYICSSQGIKFVSDLKLGHYMKVPPRILFKLQVAATLVASVTQIGVLNWMFRNIPHICTPEALNGFTCPIARVHFNGSVLWGVIGPHRFFGPGETYRFLMWAFPLGAIAPFALWMFTKKLSRRSAFRKINLPVVFGSLSWIPPATGLNFSVWALVCYFFNYVVRARKREWWSKYTMTLSAGLDSGLAFGLLVVFFGIVFPGLNKGFSWWGTEVYKQGCDWKACAYLTLKDGEKFGPQTWT